MRRQRLRLLLTFLAGVIAAASTIVVSGSVTSAATRYEDLSLFTNVLNLVRRSYVEPVDERDLVKGAVRGMLRDLDPHSSFLDADAYSEMQVDTKGEFFGLGIEITKREDGYIEVVAPIEGTPASRAGLKARDQIVTICPTETPEDWTDRCRTSKNMTLFEAVQLMRGRRGTEIEIEVFREGFEEPRPFTIVRDVVKIVSVSGRTLEPGYGYIRIRTFQESTDDDLSRALEGIHEENESLDGMVIDLRDNPGGLLDQAVRVADTWLSEGLVVYTQGRAETQRQEFRARESGTEPQYPITVIVNEGSASASEIVAGALQDQRRALVIGERSFGKGSVQTVYPLDGGSGLRLTTALYYTPGGRSIQEVGITPDIVVTNTLLAAAPDAGRQVRETDLEGHFTQADADPNGDAAAEAAAEKKDVQLARAVEVLKSWTYFDRLRPESGEAMQASAEPSEEQPVTP